MSTRFLSNSELKLICTNAKLYFDLKEEQKAEFTIKYLRDTKYGGGYLINVKAKMFAILKDYEKVREILTFTLDKINK